MAQDSRITATNEPVTVVFRRTAKPGKEKAYEAWNKKLIRLSRQQPGHLDTTVVTEAGRRYITLQHFSSRQDLDAWLESSVRQGHLAELAELVEDAPEPQASTGMETWFRLPGHSSSRHIPRWKMVIVTFTVIYAFVMAFNMWLAPYVGGLPTALRSALVPAVAVPLMTYIIMPRLTRWLRRWLYS